MNTNTSTLQILIKMRDETKGALGSLQTSLSSLGSAVAKTATRMAAFGATMAAAGATLGVKTAADLETARQGFVTLLGDAQQADEVIKRITAEAKRTPFELVGLTQATQLLSSVTKDGNKSVDVIMNIGEALAAMGKGQAELDRIIVNLQQVGAIGYASMVDIKQFAYAGIPIFEMLQTETGLAGDALADFISSGGVSFDMLTGMFDKANDEGGRFFNAFKNQAGTFSQSWANLKDTVSITMAAIVTDTGLFELVKDTLQAVAGFVDRNKDSIVALGTSLRDAFAAGRNAIQTFYEATKPAWEFLGGQLMALWTQLKTQLLPALVEFWDPVGKTLAAAIGGVLYAALVAIVEVLRVLIFTVSLILKGLDALGEWIREKGMAQLNLYKAGWEALREGIAKVVDTLKSVYDWAVKAVSKAKEALTFGKSKKVDDAVISPSGDIVSTNPRDWLIATQNPLGLSGALGVAGGITINIGNVNGTDRTAAMTLADMIATEVKYRVRL